MNSGTITKLVLAAIAIIVILVITFSSYTVVEPTERGVAVTMGKAGEEVLQPGLVVHAPFVTTIKKISLVPQSKRMTFEVGNSGAITKDMQTVGSTIEVFWRYDESRVMEAIKNYNKDIVETAITQSAVASVKENVGNYTIYELVANQEKISPDIEQTIKEKTVKYPIEITQLTISNWDWSEDFDRQIRETMQKTQEVKKAEENLKLTQTNAQQQVAEAEAKKRAAALQADQNQYAAQVLADQQLYAAQKAAEARKVEADSVAYYNAQVAKNYDVEIKLKELEIELTRAQRWDGREVPNVMPMTPAGSIVTVK